MGFETIAPGQGGLYMVKKRNRLIFYFLLIGNEHNRIKHRTSLCSTSFKPCSLIVSLFNTLGECYELIHVLWLEDI